MRRAYFVGRVGRGAEQVQGLVAPAPRLEAGAHERSGEVGLGLGDAGQPRHVAGVVVDHLVDGLAGELGLGAVQRLEAPLLALQQLRDRPQPAKAASPSAATGAGAARAASRSR